MKLELLSCECLWKKVNNQKIHSNAKTSTKWNRFENIIIWFGSVLLEHSTQQHHMNNNSITRYWMPKHLNAVVILAQRVGILRYSYCVEKQIGIVVKFQVPSLFFSIFVFVFITSFTWKQSDLPTWRERINANETCQMV